MILCQENKKWKIRGKKVAKNENEKLAKVENEIGFVFPFRSVFVF